MTDIYNNTPSTSSVKRLDQRARLRPMPRAEEHIYGKRDSNTLMKPLYESNGIIWPFTPNITLTQNVEYSDYAPTHSNQEFLAYRRTPALNITVAGVWTAQNKKEKEFCLAGMHFLRTVTKSHFGASDPQRGTPPPVLLFSAYGDLMFNDVPVVVNSVQYDFLGNGETDYVKHQTQVGESKTWSTAWIPARFQIAVTLTIQKTPSQMRNKFDLNKYRTGELLVKDKGWW